MIWEDKKIDLDRIYKIYLMLEYTKRVACIWDDNCCVCETSIRETISFLENYIDNDGKNTSSSDLVIRFNRLGAAYSTEAQGGAIRTPKACALLAACIAFRSVTVDSSASMEDLYELHCMTLLAVSELGLDTEAYKKEEAAQKVLFDELAAANKIEWWRLPVLPAKDEERKYHHVLDDWLCVRGG